ncbi:MAG: VWA domain-containing protein [Myxococcota bacterium]
MGYGSYSHAAHQAMLKDRQNLPTQKLFKQTACHALMNPKGVRARESRDSADHPATLPIVFALDVTGSMGVIPEQLARRELPNFMKALTDSGVTDPQILFMAVGDATCDGAPLQVGQFESTAELMDQWLTFSFLEGGGGGQNTESYELALYFIAEHTDTDAWVKRKKRGYVIMTGDELPYPSVSRHQVEALVGDALDEDIPVEAVVATLQETFEPFFLIPDLDRRERCERRWRDLLGDRVICLESPEHTCWAAAGLVALTEGAVVDLPAFAERLLAVGLDRAKVGAITRALLPYAGSIGKAGAAAPAIAAPGDAADGAAKSFWKRLFG